MDLEFRPLELSDRDTVWKYTSVSGLRNCDLSFLNLYAWWMLYHTEIAEWGGFLFFRFYVDGHLAYLMPVGEGDFCSAIRLLRDDASSMNAPFLMLGVTEERLPQVRSCVDNMCHVYENREHADYVYLREKLAGLSGKKLQSKRNHINRFKLLYPDYVYMPLSDEHIEDCMTLVRKWASVHDTESEQRAVAEEIQAIERALYHRDELGLTGGVIYVSGKLVAFTYGAPVNNDTFDVSAEKADTDYEGAYSIINQEFVSHLPDNFIYINREEDLGIEGLRKAKLSYKPYEILMKYSVWSAYTLDESEHESCSVEGELEVKWQVRALWKLCFGDTDDFINLYFSKKYSPKVNGCIKEDGKVISALQRLPYRIRLMGQNIHSCYISGVCTSPESRGRGYMSRLLAQEHTVMYAQKVGMSFLIPADRGLFDFYSRFGYAELPSALAGTHIGDADTLASDCEITVYRSKESAPLYEAHEYLFRLWSSVEGSVIHTLQDLDVVWSDLFMAGGVVVMSRRNGVCAGVLMAVLTEEGNVRIEESYADSSSVGQAVCDKAVHSLCGESHDANIERRVNGVMVRVTNVGLMLEAYASCLPDKDIYLNVTGDDAVADNNGMYHIAGGQCEKLESGIVPSVCGVMTCDIRELVRLLWGDRKCYITLMLN